MNFLPLLSPACLQTLVLIQTILLAGGTVYIIYLYRVIKDLRKKNEGMNKEVPATITEEPSGPKPSAAQTEHAEERPEAGVNGEITGENVPVTAECICDHIFTIEDENLRLLMKSRMDDLDDEEGEVSKALIMAGILDEIRILTASANTRDAQALQKLCKALHRTLAEMGAEIIDDDEWNSARQRASEVQYDLPTGSKPVLGEKVASGLIYQGRICRKQTVTLHMQAL